MIGGVLLGLGASVCWALANVTIQRAGQAVGAFRALLWAQLAGGAAFGLLALAIDHPTASVTGAVIVWGILAGVSALLAYVSLFFAFANGRLSVTVPIMSSWAVISAGISLGIIGERVRGSQLLGAVLVVVGVLLVARQSAVTTAAAARAAGPAGDDGRRERRAVLASLGAAVGFGVLVPAIDQIAPVAGELGAICVVYGLDIVLGLPLALALRVSLRPPPASAWPVVAWAGLFETVGFVCVSLAAVRAPLAVVAPTASLSAAITVLYAWFFLGERPGRLAAVGAALASAGVVTLSL